MRGMTVPVFRTSRIYVFLCALAGVSPLAGVHGADWDLAILFCYYLVEAIIVMLFVFWRIMACRGHPRGNIDKGTGLALAFFCSGVGIGILIPVVSVAFDKVRLFDDPARMFGRHGELFAVGAAVLLLQHGYSFVSDFWRGRQRDWSPDCFVSMAFVRTGCISVLVVLVHLLASVCGAHFALAMDILIALRIMVQTAVAIATERANKERGTDCLPPICE